MQPPRSRKYRPIKQVDYLRTNILDNYRSFLEAKRDEPEAKRDRKYKPIKPEYLRTSVVENFAAFLSGEDAEPPQVSRKYQPIKPSFLRVSIIDAYESLFTGKTLDRPEVRRRYQPRRQNREESLVEKFSKAIDLYTEEQAQLREVREAEIARIKKAEQRYEADLQQRTDQARFNSYPNPKGAPAQPTNPIGSAAQRGYTPIKRDRKPIAQKIEAGIAASKSPDRKAGLGSPADLVVQDRAGDQQALDDHRSQSPVPTKHEPKKKTITGASDGDGRFVRRRAGEADESIFEEQQGGHQEEPLAVGSLAKQRIKVVHRPEDTNRSLLHRSQLSGSRASELESRRP